MIDILLGRFSIDWSSLDFIWSQTGSIELQSDQWNDGGGETGIPRNRQDTWRWQ